MSMSMYRPKKSTSVKLSTSGLSQSLKSSATIADGSSNSIIPEDHVFSPAQLADSIWDSGSEDFHASTSSSSPPLERTIQTDKVRKGVEEQHRKKEAVGKLEEFFLGNTTMLLDPSKASPVSVLNLSQPPKEAMVKKSPIRNMFGHIIEGESSDYEGTDTGSHHLQASIDANIDSGYFLEVEIEDDVSSTSTKDPSDQHFTQLTTMDRANSLPLECMKSPNAALSKKPSLKKISSIGQGIARKNSESAAALGRAVSFTSLSIREYPPAISDNPSCSFGPPVQLDWEYEVEETQSIDHYEESRQPRRANHDLLLSYYDRRFLLLKQAGYTRKEVKEAMKEAERVKRERMVTDLFLPAQALDETLENIVDSLKGFFGKSKEPRDIR